MKPYAHRRYRRAHRRGGLDRPRRAGAGHVSRVVRQPAVARADVRRGVRREILRLRYRELTPAAFFLKAAHGRLTDDLLSEQGGRVCAASLRALSRRHMPRRCTTRRTTGIRTTRLRRR